MATRKPLVLVNGSISELPASDTLDGVTGGGGARVAKMNYFGSLTPTIGSARWYPEANVTLSKVYFSLGGASTGQVKIDVKKNGVSIFSGTLPTCEAGAFLSSSVAVSTALTPADYLTVDIVAAPDGSNLVACIVYN